MSGIIKNPIMPINSPLYSKENIIKSITSLNEISFQFNSTSKYSEKLKNFSKFHITLFGKKSDKKLLKYFL